MELGELEKQLKAFANKRRLKILQTLARDRDMSVTDIADHLDFSYKATSKHLRLLDRVGLVENKQVGFSVEYSIKKPVSKLTKLILQKCKNVGSDNTKIR